MRYSEERFTRIKHDHSFPINAINYCLDEAKINANNLDLVSYYEKPFSKFERILETNLSYSPIGLKSFLMSMPLWIKKKIWIKDLIKNELEFKGDIIFPEHHESHAASAFFHHHSKNLQLSQLMVLVNGLLLALELEEIIKLK